jgi:hypothetical protein
MPGVPSLTRVRVPLASSVSHQGAASDASVALPITEAEAGGARRVRWPYTALLAHIAEGMPLSSDA